MWCTELHWSCVNSTILLSHCELSKEMVIRQTIYYSLHSRNFRRVSQMRQRRELKRFFMYKVTFARRTNKTIHIDSNNICFWNKPVVSMSLEILLLFTTSEITLDSLSIHCFLRSSRIMSQWGQWDLLTAWNWLESSRIRNCKANTWTCRQITQKKTVLSNV